MKKNVVLRTILNNINFYLLPEKQKRIGNFHKFINSKEKLKEHLNEYEFET